MSDLNASIADVAKTVASPDGPNDATVAQRPEPLLTWAMGLIGFVICAMISAAVVALAWGHWPDADAVSRVHTLGVIATGLVFVLIAVVLRLASGAWRHADVRFGSSSISVGSDGVGS